VVAASVFVALMTCAELAVADVITDWNTIALQAILAANAQSGELRDLAMMHVAQFDALNSVEQRYAQYSKLPTYLPNAAGADEGAAANQAAYSILVNVLPSQKSTFDSALASHLSAIPDSAAKTAGINLGNAAAARMIALRANDHTSDVVPYTPGTAPGNWRPTGAAQLPAINTQWPTVTPFSIASGSAFRGTLPGPPALDSAAFAAAVNEVKDLGSINSATRTADQSNIAKFWYLSTANTNFVTGLWNRVAQTVEQTHPLNLLDSSRLFARLNMGEFDVFIATNDAKYSFNFWRPETAIHVANTPGLTNTYTNAGITADPTWTPFLVAPPFPSYASNHASLDGAAAAVLRDAFGTDNISFTASTQGMVVPDRSFTSFSQAAQEGAISRIYAGIHYPFDSDDGLALGATVGNFIVSNELTPEPGALALCGLGAAGAIFSRRRRRRQSGSSGSDSACTVCSRSSLADAH
jgi:hypothetical protein